MADGEVSDEEPEVRGFPRAQVVLLLVLILSTYVPAFPLALVRLFYGG